MSLTQILIRINAPINHISKHNHRAYIVINIKKLYFFSPKCIKINGNKINLNDKNNRKKRLLQK